MGNFISLSGLIGAAEGAVVDCLGLKSCAGHPEQPDVCALAETHGNTSLLYPNGFCEWDEVSQRLSQTLARPVFSFHIHDGDLWMYRLFVGGQEVGRFNPVPHYWEEISDAERDRWRGDVRQVCELVPTVRPQAIERYLVSWDMDAPSIDRKAYPDDEFGAQDAWQMCDFMRKLGLPYPLDDESGKPTGATYRLAAPLAMPSAQTSDAKKPWWRFW